MRFFRKPVTRWDEKKLIVQHLYDRFNINRFRYTIINETSQLEFLQKNQHYLLLNYKSQNFLMYFLFVSGVRKCVLIDRKSLAFQPKSIEDVVRSASIEYLDFNFPVRPDLFKGTLLDVKMVNNLFFVYNVFMWKGEDRCNESSIESFRLVNSERFDVIQPIREFYYKDLPKLKQAMCEDSKVTGLVFVPKIPGNQMIFLLNRQTKYHDQVEDEHQQQQQVFTMHVHSLPDVYLLESTDERKKGKRILAYIPDMKTSRKWREETINKKCLRVRCEYLASLDKYIPASVVKD